MSKVATGKERVKLSLQEFNDLLMCLLTANCVPIPSELCRSG